MKKDTFKIKKNSKNQYETHNMLRSCPTLKKIRAY